MLQAEEVCDRVAVHDLPGPGEVCEGLCAAPAGKISTCDYVADSADPSTCSDAVTPAKLGGPCASGRFCEPATYCESTCRALLLDGAECIQDYECESGSCSDERAPAKRHCDEIRRVVREECLIYNEPPVRWSGSRYERWSDGGYH